MSRLPRAPTVVLCIMLGLGLLGCGAGHAVPELVVRDSAGVRIVENYVPVWLEGQGWRIDPEPYLVLDSILEVADAAFIDRESVVAADAMLPGLRFFDSIGAQYARIGGAGTGPGEFLSPERVRLYRGDSLAAFDRGARRISIFAGDGSFGRSVPLILPGARIGFTGILADGSFVLREDGFEPNSGRWREPAVFFWIGAGGGKPDTVAVVPGREFYRVRFGGGESFGVTPFGPRTVSASGGERVVLSTQDDFSIAVLNRSGRLVLKIIRACLPRPLPLEDIKAFQAQRLAALRRPEDRVRMKALFRSGKVPFPDHVPLYSRLMVDEAGDIWAEAYPLAGDTYRTWWVFRADGLLLGPVETPPGLELREVGNDRVVGIVRDEWGRSRLQVHALIRNVEASFSLTDPPNPRPPERTSPPG